MGENEGFSFTDHRCHILRIFYDFKLCRFFELKKKKPRRRNTQKIYNQITDLDEYPRKDDNWDIKEEKDPRRG